MTNNRFMPVVILGFITGVLTAAGASLYIADGHAQALNAPVNDGFNLVDRGGKKRFSVGLSGRKREYTYMYLSDSLGRPRIRFTVYPDTRAPTMRFLDVNGRVISSAAPAAPNPSSRTPKLSSITGRATGQYAGAAAGPGDYKADQDVQPLRRPGNPGGDARRWLETHNAALLGIVHSRYSTNDVRRFRSAEQSKCRGNVYCAMAYRQQAISLIVGG